MDRATLEGTPGRYASGRRGRALAPIPTSCEGELRQDSKPDEHAVQSWGSSRNLRHKSNAAGAAGRKTQEDSNCLDLRRSTKVDRGAATEREDPRVVGCGYRPADEGTLWPEVERRSL